jgi:hypothetical protein
MERFTVLTDEYMTIYDMAGEMDMHFNNMSSLIRKRAALFPKSVGVIRGRYRDLKVFKRAEVNAHWEAYPLIKRSKHQEDDGEYFRPAIPDEIYTYFNRAAFIFLTAPLIDKRGQ